MEQLYIGEFNSEKFWENPNLAKLPQIIDQKNTEIIHSMDEILFPFCNQGDLLITRFGFNKELKKYLSDIGFNFNCNNENIQKHNEENTLTIFELIAKFPERITGQSLSLDNQNTISPYSIVPGFTEMAKVLNLGIANPSLEIVKKVNSKVYSCNISNTLNIPIMGYLVQDVESLIEKGNNLLKETPFIIKTPFGVSGNGNMLISSPNILKRITDYLQKQVNQGLGLEFILEPFLDKALDFSCNFMIDKTGNIKIVTIQKMINRGFSFMGSCTAGEELTQKLELCSYYNSVHLIGKKLYKDGYFGEVCLDSMVLKSGEIIPLVEINARKSLGLINHKLDMFLKNFNHRGRLFVFNIAYPQTLEFNHILKIMEAENLLYYPNKGNGIMLLCSNTLFINKTLDYHNDNIYKGRIYISIVANEQEEIDLLIIHFKEILEKLSCTIFS